MSLGAVLDTAIGLVFIYLLLGMIASAMQETLAAALKWRGKQLRDGIESLLAGTDTSQRAKQLTQSVFGHALVQGTSTTGLPSYVSAGNFGTALIEVLTTGSQAPLFSQIETAVAALPAGLPATQTLTTLLRQAGGDIDTLRAGMERWYNDAMDRLSGDYKRWSHYFCLAFGLLVAVVFNVSTINVAYTLWTDPQSRAAIAAAATDYVQKNAPTAATSSGGAKPQAANPPNTGSAAAPPATTPNAPPTTASTNAAPPPAQQGQISPEAQKLIDMGKTAAASLQALPLPIGWSQQQGQTWLVKLDNAVFNKDGSGVWLVLGWLATAFAVSLGAPFWFDTLQMLIQLRGAGPKPADGPRSAPASR